MHIATCTYAQVMESHSESKFCFASNFLATKTTMGIQVKVRYYCLITFYCNCVCKNSQSIHKNSLMSWLHKHLDYKKVLYKNTRVKMSPKLTIISICLYDLFKIVYIFVINLLCFCALMRLWKSDLCVSTVLLECLYVHTLVMCNIDDMNIYCDISVCDMICDIISIIFYDIK